MPKSLIPALSFLAAVIILLMVNFTTPAGIGPLGLLVFFASCYMVVLGIALLIVKIFMKLLGKPVERRSYLYAAVIAFGPIMLLLIQSLGALSPFTISIVIVLVFLVCFLINKSS